LSKPTLVPSTPTRLVRWLSNFWLGYLGSVLNNRSIPNDFSFFHHEEHSLRCGNIGKRIARHRNDVSELSLFQGASFLRDAEELGIICCGRFQCIGWRHSEINHQLKLFGVLTVWENGGIGAERNSHS